jgi:hypothetical protein
MTMGPACRGNSIQDGGGDLTSLQAERKFLLIQEKGKDVRCRKHVRYGGNHSLTTSLRNKPMMNNRYSHTVLNAGPERCAATLPYHYPCSIPVRKELRSHV